jgi:hypothetical protein
MRSNRTLALPLSASGSLVLQDSNYDVPVFSFPPTCPSLLVGFRPIAGVPAYW